MLLGPVLSTGAATTLETDMALNLQERPVMKVVRLLQDTKAQLEKELDDDKAVYQLMTCWCTSNDEEKAAAIAAGNAKIAQLESSIGAAAAKVAELKQKRKETLDEVNADHKALSDATGMRMKENKEFQASETDYIEAISASKNAIIVLGKHNPSLAQLRSAAHTMLDARVANMIDSSKSVSKANVGVLRSFLHNSET